MAKAAALKIDIPRAISTPRTGNAKEEPQRRCVQAGVEPAQSDAGGHARWAATRNADAEGHRAGSRIKIAFTDQAVTDFFNANRAQFNVPEEAYHIAQLVITPVRDPQLANGTGDDATTPEQAAAKVRMLMERLKAGASFRDLATGCSEDPESAPRGGDMGLIPVSKLGQAAPALRDAVLNKAPGSVNVASVGGAYTLVLVVAHELAGQRDLSTPGVRERITDALKSRREQLLRTAYLTAIRSDAKVVNYEARRVVESKGTVTASQPPSLLKK